MNTNALSIRQKRWLNLLQIVLLAACFLFLGQALAGHWSAVQERASGIDWGRLAGAVALMLAAMAFLPAITFIALRDVGIPARYHEAVAVYFASQLPKYLPGGLWAVPGRVILYHRHFRLPLLQGTLSVTWELLALLTGAFLIGVTIAPLTGSNLLLVASLAAALMVLIIMAFGSQHERFWRVLARSRVKTFQTIASSINEVTVLKPVTQIGMALAAALFWLAMGFAFSHILNTVTGTSLTWYEAAGIYALAWLGGFLIMIAPAGLGFRESLLVALLTPWMSSGEGAFVAVLARLLWTVAEAMWIVIGLLLLRTLPAGITVTAEDQTGQ